MSTIIFTIAVIAAIVVADSLFGLGILRTIGSWFGFNGEKVNEEVKNTLDVNKDGKVNVADVTAAVTEVKKVAKKKMATKKKVK